MKFLVLVLLCTTSVWTKSYLRRIPDDKPAPRIIGGDLARAGQYPWLAAIYKYTEDGRYFCSGSLFNEQWILTAGQCVYLATSFIIQLGSNLLQGEDENRLTLGASTYYYEPRFDPQLLLHDIGLIKLNIPITYTDYIHPVRMLSSMGPIYQGRVVEAAGWGQVSDDSALVNELRFVEMTILGQTACQTYYGEQLWGSMCCAEGNYNEGPCYGDTGSPLMTAALVGNHTIQVAIASFISINGCESLDPTGYTRVDAYYNWIVNTTRDM
ncbi:hypothetical protein Zmor_025919 [Zophobas morio]|uniref:Peptidase S1 domain-containing protein n=1 Tax=Zophobas morio TaxID=2755281 RepID=A0AA38M507_9CUCU|nr:hypothetical protein Zmor_025919 [Zophobas morio]